MGAFIVRIDKPKNDPSKGTHGWQVRVGGKRGYHSKLFSDNVYGSKGKALVAAEEYREEYIKLHPEEAGPRHSNDIIKAGVNFRYPNSNRVQKNNKSGVNGVYRTYHYFSWDKTKKPRYYWAAFCPIGPDGQRNKWSKRFYIETHGEEEAKRLAIEFRQMWEEAAKEGDEAIKRFFAQHQDGWV